MRVKDIMKTEVGFCRSDDNLLQIVEIMRQKDCGVVPIVDEENRLAGMITDRDVCFAAAPDKKVSDIKAKEIIRGEVVACAPDDKIKSTLKKMRKHQLKRLPVACQSGEIVGILSISDVLLSAKRDKKIKKQIFRTLEGIFQPRPIVLREISSAELATDDK